MPNPILTLDTTLFQIVQGYKAINHRTCNIIFIVVIKFLMCCSLSIPLAPSYSLTKKILSVLFFFYRKYFNVENCFTN